MIRLRGAEFLHRPTQVSRMRRALDMLAGGELKHQAQQVHRPPAQVQKLVDRRLR